MIQNKLALMAIPVLAAVLFGGSIAPVAYADHQNHAECEALTNNLVNAIDSGNEKRIDAMINAWINACTFGFGAECVNFIEKAIEALIDRDFATFFFWLGQLDAHDC